MILKAKHNFFLYPFFKWYAVRIVMRNFRVVKVTGNYVEQGLPVLLVANHISWWDGLWAMYLNVKFFRKRFHFMMLEEQLRKYWLFNYFGGYSVSQGSRSVIESLDYTAGLLEDPENLALIFPQGEIKTMHLQSFHFEKGLERILKHKEGRVQVILLASLTDYFSHPKPSIYLYIKEYDSHDFNLQAMQDNYNAFYRQCVDDQQQIPVHP